MIENLRVRALFELKTLPFDFVLARDHIFSANEAALPTLPALFLGESEGNEKESSCACRESPFVDVSLPNSSALSGGVTMRFESSEEISDEVELLCRKATSGEVPMSEMLPNLLKLGNLDNLEDFVGVEGVEV